MTFLAFLLLAFASIMTHAQIGPFVVQRPDDSLPAAHNFAHFIERKHTLVDPMEVYDVGFLELFRACNADAEICDVCLPEP